MNSNPAPVLGRCFLISTVALLFWLGMIVLAHDWIYEFHTQWFDLTPNQFDVIHYSGMAFFKILLITCFGIPWLALKMGRP
jgi:hypothetical protein